MPPITLHMVLARSIAQMVSQASLGENNGSYLLGATSPDIRVITRQDRFSTHYYDLDGPDHQDSVGAFLAQNSRFIQPENLNPETRAWVCGYISHLVMDELYITGIYRPYFAQADALGGALRANVMDRLLQFDLDRVYGNDPELKRDLCEALSCTVEGIEAGFVDAETLERWRKVSFDVAAQTMDYDRMRKMTSNFLKYSGVQGEELTAFLDSLPDLLDETIAHVTNPGIEGFVRRSEEIGCEAVARYLGCG